jgi:hypothetical protein
MAAWTDWLKCLRDHSEARGSVRTLLFVIATYADDEGRCYPSLDKLAAGVGLRRRQIIKLVQQATDRGYLAIEQRGLGRGHSTRYRLLNGVSECTLCRAEKGARRDTLSPGEKVHSRTRKGALQGTEKVHSSAPEGSKNLPEHAREDGALLAPVLGASQERDRGAQRRELGKAIREAGSLQLERRYRATFDKLYGHLYGRGAAA